MHLMDFCEHVASSKRSTLHRTASPSVSSQLLIKDETPNPTAMPKLAYKYTCSSKM